MRQTFVRGLTIFLGAAALLATAGCASSKGPRPPFPSDPDACAAYCLKWVEPVYRDVPVVSGPCGKCVTQKVRVERVEFDEVVKPGCYETRRTPDRCRQFGAVEVEPARDEWVRVACNDPCGCGVNKDCYKPVRIPPKYKWCEKTETEKGIAYCAFTPPEYAIVPRTVTKCETVERYVPADPKVTYRKELFEPGHWVWEKRYDCPSCEKKACPPRPNCAPCGDFRRCPSAD